MQVHLTIPRYLRIGPQATPVSAKKLCADCQCVLRAANETGRCSVHQAAYEERLGRVLLYADAENLRTDKMLRRSMERKKKRPMH